MECLKLCSIQSDSSRVTGASLFCYRRLPFIETTRLLGGNGVNNSNSCHSRSCLRKLHHTKSPAVIIGVQYAKLPQSCCCNHHSSHHPTFRIGRVSLADHYIGIPAFEVFIKHVLLNKHVSNRSAVPNLRLDCQCRPIYKAQGSSCHRSRSRLLSTYQLLTSPSLKLSSASCLVFFLNLFFFFKYTLS